MTAPIRITYRENLDYFVEAQSQSPPSAGRQISEKTQRILLGATVVVTLIFAFGNEYRKNRQIGFLLASGIFVLVIGAFWLWFFKKLGLFKKTNFQDYRWTKKDRDRFERYYEKRGGDETPPVVCELNENGVSFNPGRPVFKVYNWNAVLRVVERPKGLFLYVRSWIYVWLPRAAFGSQTDYQTALELMATKVKLERLNLPGMAFVALGANLGDRVEILLEAFQFLREISDYPMLKSSFWETTPVDCMPDSPMFLNAVVAMTPKTEETPESLLAKLQKLEKKFGRKPKKAMNEPRPLDLDIIAFGKEIRATSTLTLPHPRAHLRRFVLEPLAEIAPDLVLPGQKARVTELLRELTSAEVVRRLV